MVIVKEVTSKTKILDLFRNEIKKPILLTPGPREADSIREFNKRDFFENKIDPITISSFIKIMIDRMHEADTYPKGMHKNVSRKSEILTNLASFWESVFGAESEELFFQAYQMVSEFRGSTLEISLMEEAISLLGEDLGRAINLLWSLLDEQGIVDEHRAYKIISDNVEKIEFENDGIILIGFNFLSAVQVDMVNRLSSSIKVIVTLPKGISSCFTRFDWPVWLNGFGDGIDNSFSFNELDKPLVFPQNRFGSLLNKKGDFKNIVLLKDKIVSSDFFEFPDANFDYRASHDLFSVGIEEIYEIIRSSNCRDLTSVKKDLKNRGAEFLIEQSKRPSNFLRLKVIHLFYKAIEAFESEIIGQGGTISPFLLRVCKQVCLLNAPRTSITNSARKDEAKFKIYTIGEIKFKQLDHVSLVIKKDDLPFRVSVDSSNREMLSFLSTIGPVKSTELNNKFDIYWLMNSIHEAGHHEIFIEDGCLEIGDELFKFLNISKDTDYFYDPKKTENVEVSKKKYGPNSLIMSATKLQNYVDCPKKFEEIYYFEDKAFPRLKHELLPSHLGIVEHKVLEYFYKRGLNTSDLKLVDDLSLELLKKFIIDNKLDLSEINFIKYLNQVSVNAKNGVRFLNELSIKNPGIKFSFEVNVSEDKISVGRVDLVVEFGNEFIIIDFKRSKGGAASISSILDFQAVQLPFYLNTTEKRLSKRCVGFGYIVLSNLNESVFLSDAIDFHLPRGKVKKMSNEQWIAFKARIDNKIDELKDRIQGDLLGKNFEPSPRALGVCEYCPARIHCRFEWKAEEEL